MEHNELQFKVLEQLRLERSIVFIPLAEALNENPTELRTVLETLKRSGYIQYTDKYGPYSITSAGTNHLLFLRLEEVKAAKLEARARRAEIRANIALFLSALAIVLSLAV